MKRPLRLFFAVVLLLGCWGGTARGEAIFQYWTELRLANLTGYDIQITRVAFKHLDEDVTHVEAGTIIKAEDPANPSDPVRIGKVNKYSAGVRIELWFKLLGHEGREDCYLCIDNPYKGKNTVEPKKSFPLKQCPSIMTTVAGTGAQVDTPLYHNIELPVSGHKLELVSILAFQDMYQEGSFDDLDEAETTREIDEQLDSAESDRSKFMQEFGVSLPGPK